MSSGRIRRSPGSGARVVTGVGRTVSLKDRRPEPSVDGLSDANLKKIDSLGSDYLAFLETSRTAFDTVDAVRKRWYPQNRKSCPYMFMENDEGGAFALAKIGKASIDQGLVLLFAHTDSPSLKLKPTPALVEWDPELREMTLGVELDTLEYGGLNRYQWRGRPLEVRGRFFKGTGERRDVSLLVHSPDRSPHNDHREEEKTPFKEAHSMEEIDLVTGYRSAEELFKELGVRSVEEFACASLFAVPTDKPTRIGRHILAGYGHDAKSGIYAALRALESVEPNRTAIVVGFDREEVGNDGSGGAQSRFLEKFLDEVVLRKTSNSTWSTDRGMRRILEKSLAVNIDVEIGLTGAERTNYEEGHVDLRGAAKLGYGVFISGNSGNCEGDQTSPIAVAKLLEHAENANVVCQITGEISSADDSFGTGTMNHLLERRGVYTVNAGIPVGSIHSPSELIHQGDLWAAYELYKTIIKRP